MTVPARAEMTGEPTAGEGEQLLAGITAAIERVLRSVTEVGEAMTALTAAARAARRPLRRADLATLRPLVAQVLARHRGLAAGAGVVLAPDALADAPRWIDWWWADRGIGQLEVDLDPGSAEFYDYTTTEWYREPARTGRPCIAGPYVDYICTHEYTFTVSVPVVDEGRFMGVAGADILAGEVERMLLPKLSLLGRPGRPSRAGQRQRPGDRFQHRTHPARHGAAATGGQHDEGRGSAAVDAGQRAGAGGPWARAARPRLTRAARWRRAQDAQCGNRAHTRRSRAVT